MADRIVIGWNADAQRVERIPIPGEDGGNLLVGGSTGGGKTRAIHALIAQLAEVPDLALAINDPTGGMDYQWWQPRCSSLALEPEGAGLMLGWAERELKYRLRLGKQMGVTTLPVSAEHPRIVVVFDEMAMVLGDKRIKNAEARLTKLAQVGRKVNLGLLLATQHAKSTIVSTVIRGQCPIRLCLRQKTSEGTDTILESQTRWPAHLIPFHQVGVGYAALADGRTVKVRVPFVSDDEIKATAERTAHLTPTLPDENGWQRLWDPIDHEDEESE